jgi:hypothetical protein
MGVKCPAVALLSLSYPAKEGKIVTAVITKKEKMNGHV